MKYKLYSIVCVLMMSVPALLSLLLPPRAMSRNENRYLAKAPAFSIQALDSGSFQEGLESYLSDQFPGRDTWMQLNTLLKLAAGYRDIGDVYLCRDGFMMQMHPQGSFDEAKYLRSIGYLRRFAEDSGVPAKALLIPSAASVLEDKLPPGAASYDAAAAYRLARDAFGAVAVPDLTQALKSGDSTQYYYHTDHHWTAAGALIGYQCLTEGSGRSPGTRIPFCQDFYGTAWSRTLLPFAKPDSVELFDVPQSLRVTADGEEISLYDFGASERKDKYTVFLGGNHGIVTIEGGCSNGRTLLVIKDSFANCLAPLLTSDYETVILIDLRYYSGSLHQLLSSARPDELLFVFEMSGLASGDDFVKLLM